MLNKCIIMGRCAKDPEKRMTTSGVPVASVTLACDRDFKGKDGNKETDWIDVVAYRETANFLSNYFSKGRMAVVSGRLQIRSYTDKDGNNRRAAEVVADNVYFGDSKPTASDVPYAPSYTAPAQDYNAPEQDFSYLADQESQLPF
jgi:single-strand DNA-binding protein